MAIIRRHEDARKMTNQTDGHGRYLYEDILCPICNAHMVHWNTSGYGSGKTECFSETCLALRGGSMNIALIRGDSRSFVDRDYAIAQGATVEYPSAKIHGDYSEDLRNAVKSTLEDWGFTHISFVEPDGKEKSEQHTVVRGIHKDPHVNVALREVPKPQRALTFDNKFGVIYFKRGFHETHENQYHGWGHIVHEVSAYHNQMTGEYLYPKNIVLNVNRIFADEVVNQETRARKREMMHRVYKYQIKMEELQRSVKSYADEIEGYKKKYQETFGEPYPEK